MRITLKQLKSLVVETVSGTSLGHVHDLILQTDGQLIAQYVVKSAMIGGTEYLVGREQIVRFEEKKLIVDDSVSSKSSSSAEKKSPMRITPKPIAMRE